MQGNNNDYTGVLSSLSSYFDALHTNDADRMKRVWHERCCLRRIADDGDVVSIDAPCFFEIVSSKSEPAPGAPAAPWLADRVASIDFASPGAAAAKLEITLNATTYTDYLALLRLAGGEWRIVSKLFASRPCADAGIRDAGGPKDAAALAARYLRQRRGDAEAALVAPLLHPTFQSLSVSSCGSGLLTERVFDAGLETTCGGGADWDRVVSIDKSGPDTALAKVHIGHTNNPTASSRDVDRVLAEYLMLARTDGHAVTHAAQAGWQIVARIAEADVAAA